MARRYAKRKRPSYKRASSRRPYKRRAYKKTYKKRSYGTRTAARAYSTVPRGKYDPSQDHTISNIYPNPPYFKSQYRANKIGKFSDGPHEITKYTGRNPYNTTKEVIPAQTFLGEIVKGDFASADAIGSNWLYRNAPGIAGSLAKDAIVSGVTALAAEFVGPGAVLVGAAVDKAGDMVLDKVLDYAMPRRIRPNLTDTTDYTISDPMNSLLSETEEYQAEYARIAQEDTNALASERWAARDKEIMPGYKVDPVFEKLRKRREAILGQKTVNTPSKGIRPRTRNQPLDLRGLASFQPRFEESLKYYSGSGQPLAVPIPLSLGYREPVMVGGQIYNTGNSISTGMYNWPTPERPTSNFLKGLHYTGVAGDSAQFGALSLGYKQPYRRKDSLAWLAQGAQAVTSALLNTSSPPKRSWMNI